MKKGSKHTAESRAKTSASTVERWNKWRGYPLPPKKEPEPTYEQQCKLMSESSKLRWAKEELVREALKKLGI